MEISLCNIPLVRGKSHCEKVDNLNIKSTKALQVSSLLRARAVKVFDRGNLKTVVTFDNTRRHTNNEAATAFAMSHAKELSLAHGDVTFKADSGLVSFSLRDASVRVSESQIDGVLSKHRYEIVGSQIEINTK